MIGIVAASVLYRTLRTKAANYELEKYEIRCLTAIPGLCLNPNAKNHYEILRNLLKGTLRKTPYLARQLTIPYTYININTIYLNTILLYTHGKVHLEPDGIYICHLSLLVVYLRGLYCHQFHLYSMWRASSDWVGRSRSKERDRKSELVLRSTYQIFEWDRNNSDRNFYNVVRYVHIPLVPWMQERRAIWPCLNVATWRRDRAIQQIR